MSWFCWVAGPLLTSLNIRPNERSFYVPNYRSFDQRQIRTVITRDLLCDLSQHLCTISYIKILISFQITKENYHREQKYFHLREAIFFIFDFLFICFGAKNNNLFFYTCGYYRVIYVHRSNHHTCLLHSEKDISDYSQIKRDMVVVIFLRTSRL